MLKLDSLSPAALKVLKESLNVPEEETQAAAAQKKEEKPALTIESLASYLAEKGVSVRHNEITKTTEITGLDGESPEHLLSNLPSILFSELQESYRRCTVQIIANYIDIIATRNRFCPVLDLLNSREYDAYERFGELYEILGLPEEDRLSRVLVRKWLVQCVSLLHNDPAHPFGAEGLLVLTGRQGIGKTTFFRTLAMRPEFFREGQYIDFRDKDSYIRCLFCWIAELGELESTFKSDVERLKAFITNPVDSFRRPYGRADVQTVRRTSLCGTCNSARFLTDTTGNRRFWTIPVENIDLERLKKLDVLQLWKQAQYRAERNPQEFRLTREEQRLLAERNSEHEKPMKGETEIYDILNEEADGFHVIPWEYQTVTQFKRHYDELLRPFSAKQIAEVLDKMGYNLVFKRTEGTIQRMRYLLKKYQNTSVLTEVNVNKSAIR